MGKSNNNETFRDAKRLRLSILGHACELCLQPSDALIGHHTEGRNRGKETWEYCQIRCRPCETWMHQMYRSGNDTYSDRTHQRNNALIRRILIAEGTCN